MLCYQGIIKTRGGLIYNMETAPGSVTVISETDSYVYKGGYAYPGFTDSHGHVFGLGIKMNMVALDGAKSASECVDLARQSRFFLGDWLIARGWNQELWPGRQFPDKKLLDEAFPSTPVYLVRVDGHSAWVNSKALEIAGIDENTADPAGGAIIRDESGRPTGVLLDNAMDMVFRLIPPFSKDIVRNMILDSVAELASKGLTEVVDMDVDPAWVEVFKALDESNLLPIKIRSYVKGQNYEWRNLGIKPHEGRKFSVCGVKFYADGALGSRGAALLEPYSDDPSNKGLLLLTKEELYERAAWALGEGFNIAVHAIGDAANRLVLQTYADLFDNHTANDDSVLRVEHAQIIHPDDLEYFRRYKIYASVQPVHCTSDAIMARQRLGGRCDYSYPWETLRAMGVDIAGGSDFPIESHDPVTGLDAFIRRVPINEKERWYPNERLGRSEALKAYTINARLIEKTSGLRGELADGRQADIVVLDRNILECPEEDIAGAKVLAVFSNGEMVYEM